MDLLLTLRSQNALATLAGEAREIGMGDYQRLDRRPEPCPGPPDCPLEEKVGKIYHDLYFGYGPEYPPFTTRVLLHEKNQIEAGAMLTRIEKVAGKIVFLLLTAILTGIGDIIVHAVPK